MKYALLQDTTASLCFRAQRIFLQNASGWFGSVPLEASGDFGIEPEEGEFHLMFQVIFTKFHMSYFSLGWVSLMLGINIGHFVGCKTFYVTWAEVFDNSFGLNSNFIFLVV